MSLLHLCADELWDGEMESFEAGGTVVLLIKLEGRYCAYQAACPLRLPPRAPLLATSH